MPSFYIVSLLERQKQKYWGRIERARQDLAQFEESLDNRLSEHVAAAVRQHIQLPWDRLLRGEPLPEVPVEGQDALAEAKRLIRAETSLTRHLHSPVCCYGEGMKPPYVLWCHGITWTDIELIQEDGKVSLKYVLMLLDALLTRKPRFPTRREIRDFQITAEALDGWDVIFPRKKRHLVRFLRTAAHLEEDLTCGIL